MAPGIPSELTIIVNRRRVCALLAVLAALSHALIARGQEPRNGAPLHAPAGLPATHAVTREIMTEYYKGLKEGLVRGEALREVKLSMLKRKDRQHPFYWPSFIQSGESANLDGNR
jgi:hypothetical protein